MPLTERDPNISGRNSRASDFSNGSKGQYSRNGTSKQPDLMGSAGVLNMLRTTTDFGNVASLAVGSTRSHPDHRPLRPRSGANSRLSTASTHSQGSRRQSHHRAWPSVSSAGPRRSITSNLAVPVFVDQIPPGLAYRSDASGLPPPPTFFPDGRSYSLSSAVPTPLGLANHRSLSSLRSHESHHRPQSPYRYPTRLKRPGYRPSSPALSDIAGVQGQGSHHGTLGSRLRHVHGQLQPLESKSACLHRDGENNSAPFVTQTKNHNHAGRGNAVPRKRSASVIPSHAASVSTASSYIIGPSGSLLETAPSAPVTPVDPLLRKSSTKPFVDVAPSKASDSNAQSAGAFYYDYSEQFDQVHIEKRITELYEETMSSPVPMGFVQRIKALLEEQAVGEMPAASTPLTMGSDNAKPNGSFSLDLPELPATPVVIKRITRELILSAISPTSDDSGTDEPPTPRQSQPPVGDDPNTPERVEITPTPQPAPILTDNRQSLRSEEACSQTHDTLSTFMKDLAVRYSMPGSMPESDSSSSTNMEAIDIDSGPLAQVSLAPVSESPLRNEPQELPIAMPTPVKKPSIARLVNQSDMIRTQTLFVPSSSPNEFLSRNSLQTIQSTCRSNEPLQTTPPGATNSKEATISAGLAESLHIGTSSAETNQIEGQQGADAVQAVQSPVSPLAPDELLILQSSGPQSPVSPLASEQISQEAASSAEAVVPTARQLASWPFRKSVPLFFTSAATAQPTDSPKELSRENTTTDLRFSAFRPVGNLPDIKEAPSLESSQASLRTSTFRFPMPGTSIPKAPVNRIGRSVDVTSKRDSARDSVTRAETRSLYDTREIPSLNFSQINLFTKLNEAFDQRRRSSLDTFPRLSEALPEPARDSGVMREKYRSLFGSLNGSENQAEGITGPIDNLNQDDDALGLGKNSEPDLEPATTVAFPTLRPLSPNELIDEVNRISVPSIAALTHRLSELLPSLKRYYGGEGNNALDDPVESTISEIRKLGNITPLPDCSDRAVVDGWPSENPRVIENVTDTTEASVINIAHEVKPGTPRRSVSHPGYGGTTPLAELEVPTPAVLRARSLSDSGIDAQMNTLRVSNTPLTHRRSLASSSPTESRPWNLEASYPWASTVPAVDISLPPPTLRRDTVKALPSKLRLRLSEQADETDESAQVISKPNSLATPQDYAENTQSTQDTFGSPNRRKRSRRSILGSISRKIGLSGGPGPTIDNSGGYLTGPSLLHCEERTVDPGDRYPTTGLSPPSPFNIEEVRSFFSDDSSHLERRHQGGSFRKRLTQLKSKIPPVTRTQSALDRRSPAAERSESFFGSGPRSTTGGSIRRYPDGTSGMSRTEFIRKKISERLRFVWYRGAEIIRSMSVRKKPQPLQDEPPMQEEPPAQGEPPGQDVVQIERQESMATSHT